MRPIIVYDFDNTITIGDSFWLILRAGLIKELYRIPIAIFIFPISLVLVALFRGEHRPFKSAVLWTLTVGKKPKEALKFIRNLVLVYFADRIRKELVNKSQEQFSSSRIIVASASSRLWIRPLLRKINFPYHYLISSELHWFMGGLCMKGKNCIKQEKPLAIHRKLGIENYDFVYTDHKDDISLIQRSKNYELIGSNLSRL